MPQSKQGASLTEERRMILSMLTSVRLADVESIAGDSTRSELQAAMREQLRLLPQLTTAIERRYFNLTEERPHRVHTRLEPKFEPGNDLRCEPQDGLPLLRARGAVAAHRAHVAARASSIRRCGATRC